MKLNRRGFLSALGALATTAAVPSIPAIPLGSLYNPIVLKLAMNSMYGKMFHGGRVYYSAPDGIITSDIRSAYPCNLVVREAWKINPRIST